MPGDAAMLDAGTKAIAGVKKRSWVSKVQFLL